jgi:hypothetical protein
MDALDKSLLVSAITIKWANGEEGLKNYNHFWDEIFWDVPIHPMLHHKTYKKKKPRCKHSDEVILFALECTHCCILSGTFHKSQP